MHEISAPWLDPAKLTAQERSMSPYSVQLLTSLHSIDKAQIYHIWSAATSRTHTTHAPFEGFAERSNASGLTGHEVPTLT
jgi:hypothetical protein